MRIVSSRRIVPGNYGTEIKYEAMRDIPKNNENNNDKSVPNSNEKNNPKKNPK